MPASLTSAETAQYRRDGFLFPIRVIEPDRTAALRAEIEALERRYPDGSLPQPLQKYFRVNGQVAIPLLARIASTPAVLDAVQSLLGPDLLIWSCELFIKEAGSTKIVSWHQDLTYWGFGGTDGLVTAWIALSPATSASGCMRFVAGSQQREIVPHRDTFADDNLLSRGQEIAVEVDEREAVDVALAPGEMSLHHGKMFHGSGPNASDDRRIGVAIRYVTPGVRQMVGARDYAMLVRGADAQRNWINVAAPDEPFGADALALYDRILADQTTVLTEGAEQPVDLYAGGDAATTQ